MHWIDLQLCRRHRYCSCCVGGGLKIRLENAGQKIKSRLKCCAKASFRKRKILSVHRDIRNVLEMRADQAVRGERVAQSKLSDAEYHTSASGGKKRNYLLSEARSELDQQEFEGRMRRIQYAASFSKDGKFYQAKQLSDQSQKEKSCLCTEWDRRERVKKIVGGVFKKKKNSERCAAEKLKERNS